MKNCRVISLLLILCILFSGLTQPICAIDTAAEPGTAAESPVDEAESPETEEDAASDEDQEQDTDDLPAEDAEFSVNAEAAMLIELNSNTIVYALNPDSKVYPASLTKIMTVMLALELCTDLSEEVTVTESALEGLDPDGVSVALSPGEIIPMRELLYCMMIPSANDACNVVAEHLGGSIDAFVAKMNEKATALGCTGTHFANPDGLHEDDHYTTARDLSIITQAALQNELFCTMMSTAIYTVPATNISPERVLHTTNYLMSTAINPDYYYEKASGVKTGYTSKAGRCLISTAKQGDFHFLSIVTGCETIQSEEGPIIYDSFVQTKKLLEHGLHNFSFTTVISQLVPVAQVPVTEASVDSVVLAPAENVTALLPSDYDETKLETVYTLTDNAASLQAPLTTDQDVGTITIYYNGSPVGTTTLRPITPVERHIVEYAAKSVGNVLLKYLGFILLGVVVLLVIFYVVRVNQIKRQREAARRRRAAQRRQNGEK